jgi:hypothetical protein
MVKMPIAALRLSMCCALAAGATAPAHAVQDTLQLQPDGTALVEGVVLENLRGCERDLPCTLRLRVQGRDRGRDRGREVQLQYHPGEGETACPEAIVRQGLAVAPGARVQARGRYRLAGTLHLVDLCSAPDAYLRVAPPR